MGHTHTSLLLSEKYPQSVFCLFLTWHIIVYNSRSSNKDTYSFSNSVHGIKKQHKNCSLLMKLLQWHFLSWFESTLSLLISLFLSFSCKQQHRHNNKSAEVIWIMCAFTKKPQLASGGDRNLMLLICCIKLWCYNKWGEMNTPDK